MKVTPLASGTGVPSASNVVMNTTADASKMARAKAIAAGETPQQREVSTPPPQNVNRIKMHTQRSPDRPVITQEAAPADGGNANLSQGVEPQGNGTEVTKPIDPQVAAILKAKRALQVKEREIAQREEALKAQSGQAPSVDPAKYLSIDDLKANPLKVFEAGLTYDQLTEALLANPAPQAVDVKAIREQLKEELRNELKEEFGNRDAESEKQVLGQYKREVDLLTREGEKYEAIREANAQRDVVSLIQRVWKEGWEEQGFEPGHLLSVEDAADFVENFLIEDAVRFAKISKVQTKLTPAQASQSGQTQNQRVMRTLTSRDTATPPMDRRSRAIARFYGQKV